ncbi:hypothetical protein [Noviherbaspirillum galbum]|uniref:Uncharacterized protein n=1 Tax=Noviherbaspirillum galbum TaxID=2709383 RepID=A0A6B3SZU0_9BURK|nr:hypothetical protein [Noviherbaspirillum galbum]NEX64619.1 hypothetical protein [Noviherbaspirillum galbum]
MPEVSRHVMKIRPEQPQAGYLERGSLIWAREGGVVVERLPDGAGQCRLRLQEGEAHLVDGAGWYRLHAPRGGVVAIEERLTTEVSWLARLVVRVWAGCAPVFFRRRQSHFGRQEKPAMGSPPTRG